MYKCINKYVYNTFAQCSGGIDMGGLHNPDMDFSDILHSVAPCSSLSNLVC